MTSISFIKQVRTSSVQVKNMKNTDIIIKKSKINKSGVFASRDFKKGEVVLKWKPKILKKSEIKKLLAEEKHYVYQDESDSYFLMQAPREIC